MIIVSIIAMKVVFDYFLLIVGVAATLKMGALWHNNEKQRMPRRALSFPKNVSEYILKEIREMFDATDPMSGELLAGHCEAFSLCSKGREK